jgi:hypothetical protein
MLWESSKMEQRYGAVLGVIRDGFTVTSGSKVRRASPECAHLVATL